MEVYRLNNRQAHSLELKSKAFEGHRSHGKTWVNVDLRNTSSSSYSVRLQGRLKFECFGPDLTETVFDYKGNLLRLR